MNQTINHSLCHPLCSVTSLAVCITLNVIALVWVLILQLSTPNVAHNYWYALIK